MKILNFGSLNIDYVYDVDHVVCQGETISSYSVSTFSGGKGFNQSVALKKAGADVYHAGIIGSDGKILLDACKEFGIKSEYIKISEGKSGHAIIQVDKNSENSILLYSGTNRTITKDYVDSVLNDFSKGDLIVLQNEINNIPYIVDSAYDKEMVIAINPSPFDDNLKKCDLRKIDIFLINEIEGRQMTGESTPDFIIKKMKEIYPKSKIVLTLGEKGVIYADEFKFIKQDIFKTKTVDTTAAGDTFAGYFLNGLIKNIEIEKLLKVSCCASSITVSRKGSAISIPTEKEVYKIYKSKVL